MTTNELFSPFGWTGFSWSFYVMVNMFVAACCTLGIATMGWRNVRNFARPSFLVAALSHCIFQWPLAIFSHIFERSLAGHWFFAMSIHTVIVAAILWTAMTPGLTRRVIPSGPARSTPLSLPGGKSQVLIFGLGIGLAAVYLARVGWNCTGLYAMLFDPMLTLLARETSIKLAGSGVATLAYGILANVICPIAVYLSVLNTLASVNKKQIIRTCAWVGAGVFSLCIALLSGAKGALIPTLIVTGIALLLSRRTWLSRMASLLVLLVVWVSLFSVFEVIRERKILSAARYNFGVCANRLDACTEAKTLLDSLRYRDGSLGLTRKALDRLDLQLYCACTTLAEQPAACIQLGAATPTDSKSQDPFSILGMRESIGRWYLRYGQYAAAIIYRMNVLPIQVASWHFRYTEDFGTPGVYALPLAIKLMGSSIDVPHLVHKVYGSIYSEGDQTSTGTAPTSFLVAYPAYFKFWGLCLAVGALLLFDVAATAVLGRTGYALRWAGIGLVSVGCINFLLSDLGAALLSHGLAFALILLTVLAFIEKSGQRQT